MPIDIRKPLKQFLPHLVQAKDQNLNEADTVQRLMKLFEDVLGYDAISDLSREANLKGKYADLILKVDGVAKLIIEAKAAGTTLRDRHIEQAQGYASRNNYRWVALTNGIDWNLYHLTFEEGIEYERAFSITLCGDDRKTFDEQANFLALLHKNSIKRGELEDFWEKVSALSPAAVGEALFEESVLSAIRRELRRDTGLMVDVEDIASAIQNMLSVEAREAIGPVRIRKRRAAKRGPRLSPEARTPEVATFPAGG